MSLNREQRRALEQMRRNTAKRVRKSGDATVTLQGGPMDLWVVTPDAPVFTPGWGGRSGYPGMDYGTPYYDDEYGATCSRWGKTDGEPSAERREK